MRADKSLLPGLSVFASKALVKAFGGRQEASVTFDGAVLFADMSGYTALAEELCAKGADGREQLSQILNQAFALHVESIHQAGGEIASFTGDGILAYWPAEDLSLDHALTAAEACSTALHDIPNLHAQDYPGLPELHIGIAAGQLWAAQLGGVDGAWYQILTGSAAKSAFEAGNKAKVGETVLARSDRNLDGGGRNTSGLRDAAVSFVPVKDQVSPDTLAEPDLSHVPRVVREWWTDERRRWLPQVRMISALFVKIDGLPSEHDDNLQTYQRTIATLQRALRPYSASAGTLVADDKGLVLKLCFGMPYNTHRNDCTQALQSALAISRELDALGLACTAGIANGEGICMPLGGRDRLEYTTIGRFSHLAARLMDTPDAAVLCTPDVADLAAREIELVEQSPIKLKGVRDPLGAFRAKAVMPLVPSDHHPLLGRASELSLLAEHLQRLRSGQGSILHILGDAGIGKTALVEHLIDAATSANLTVLVGRSTMSEMVVSFRAWRPVFAHLLGLKETAGTRMPATADIAARLRGLPEEARKHLPLMNAVIPGLIDTPSQIESLSGEARVDATLSFLSGLFRFLVPPAFILILEDCHWMDSASWQLLQRLTTTAPDMLIVLTSRPSLDTDSLKAIAALPRFKELFLKPLDSDAIKQVVAASVPVDLTRQEDQTRLDQAVHFAMGNPLFAKEYAYLIDQQRLTLESRSPGPSNSFGRGMIGLVGGHREGALKSSSPSLSMTLQSLIISRLDSLRPPALMALKAASVIGSQFDLPLLEYVAPDTPKPRELLKTIADLIRHHVVLAIDKKARTYRFQHDLIREVVYSQLTGEQKQLLHNRAAQAIEQVHHQHLPSQFAMLADHWSKAGVGVQTIKYAELAAAQAVRSGGYVEARRLLMLCFERADRDNRHRVPITRRISWYRLSADAHFGLGNLAERGRDAETALRIFGKRPARNRQQLIASSMATLLRWGGARLAGRFGRHAGRQEPDLSLEIARIYRHRAAVAWFSNDPLAMTAHSIEALYHAEQGTPSDVLAGASVEFGGILGLIGLRSPGRSMMQRALAIAEEVGDLAMLAYVHLLIGLYEVGVGNWAVADRSALACEKLCDHIGDRVNWSNVQALRFWSPFYRNQLDIAGAMAARLHERVAMDGNAQHQAWAHRFSAVLDLRHQRPEAARQHLEHALDALGNTQASNETFPALALMALARYRSGDRAGAFQAALDGFSLMETVTRPTGHSMLEGYAALSEVTFHALLEERNSPTWQTAFGQCLEGLKRYQQVFPIGTPRFRIWQGLSLALDGRFQKSYQSFEAASASAQRLGMPWEQNLAAMVQRIGPERFLEDLRSQAVVSGVVETSSA